MEKVSGLAEFIRQAATDPVCRVRIAPTPSGYLHAGNAINFILNFLCAAVHPAGHILLRIDDLDDDRKRPEYVADIFDTLDWLGIHWHSGPADAGDFENNWSQKYFINDISPALTRLAQQQSVFACRKSRKDLAPFGGDYPDIFRTQGLSLTDPEVAWRAQTPPEFPLPCFVVRRRDGIPAYQLASVCWDEKWGITHIIRGEDLLPSSAAQYWLAEQAGCQHYKSVKTYHHPLITDGEGNKLSKSAGAASLRTLYMQNEKPAIIFQKTAKWLGIPAKNIQKLSDLVALFNEHVPKV